MEASAQILAPDSLQDSSLPDMGPLAPGPTVTLPARILSAGVPQSHLTWGLNTAHCCTPTQPEAPRAGCGQILLAHLTIGSLLAWWQPLPD